jgi:hypothetical protein
LWNGSRRLLGPGKWNNGMRVVEPRLALSCALDHWSEISAGLAESPRKRKTQAEKCHNKTS